MNEHLEKAKQALEGAKALHEGLSPEEHITDNVKLHRQFAFLVDIAAVQASVAQAEALTKIAAALER